MTFQSTAKWVNVAVMAAIRYPLTYRVPHSLDVRPGQRVLVPLETRQVKAIVLETVNKPAPGIRVREITRVLDRDPVLSAELIETAKWIQDYYLAPLGEVFSSMLPLRSETHPVRTIELTDLGRKMLEELTGNLLEEARSSEEATFLGYVAAHPEMTVESLRRKFPDGSQLVKNAEKVGWIEVRRTERERQHRQTLSVSLATPLPKPTPRLSPVARRILELLEQRGATEDHRELLKSARASLAHLKKLSQASLVELHESQSTRSSQGGPSVMTATSTAQLGLSPNAAQAKVLEELSRHLDNGGFRVVLLHGVTGSGKTEVYLRLIARCLELGRTSLMLVPEISLTPAVQSQFLTRFGNQVALLHSGLSEGERHEEWWRVRRGEARVVLGTRSAVFAPLSNLGLIIVDEEHDSSYKQQETPRYHGRDVAVVRAHLAGALSILGSATPSLESYQNAKQEKYHLLVLEKRIGDRPLASVEIVDMRQEFRETHVQVPISRRLKEEIAAQLQAGAQTMILLNRRGWSWFLLCRSCGQSVRCRNCSISLTYHRREHRLICHYCDYSTGVPARCPSCNSEYLQFVGEGTEKLEQKLADFYPGTHIERLDRDVARRRGYFRKVLSDFSQGEINILVGTQLIAKGHDFPGVTLVGIVSADSGLSLPDFRAAEHAFQLLTQAAGRAGRGENAGRVIVQTFYPEHYAIRLAADQNYAGFFSKEMGFRRMMHYPPATALANVVAQDTKLDQAVEVAKQIDAFFASLDLTQRGIKLLGPNPAPLARIERRYRIQFLLKAKSRALLNSTLRDLLAECDRKGISPRSVMVDVDPVSIM